jgi:hypothetical protein
MQRQAFVVVRYACFGEDNAQDAMSKKREALLAVVPQASLPQRILHWQTLRDEHLLPNFRRLGSCFLLQHLHGQMSRKHPSPLLNLTSSFRGGNDRAGWQAQCDKLSWSKILNIEPQWSSLHLQVNLSVEA